MRFGSCCAPDPRASGSASWLQNEPCTFLRKASSRKPSTFRGFFHYPGWRNSLLVNYRTLSNAPREGRECGPCLRRRTLRLARWYSGLYGSKSSALSSDIITRAFRPEPSQPLSRSHTHSWDRSPGHQLDFSGLQKRPLPFYHSEG